MSEEWNGMNESQKTSYNISAKGDTDRYEREKKEYEKTKVAAVPNTGKTSTPKPAGKGNKKTPVKEPESVHEESDEEEDDE